MDKKQKLLIIIVAFLGILILGMSGFRKIKTQTEIENVFENAMDNISINYITYGDYSNECLLYIINNNDFQVNLSGIIEKQDENGVEYEDWNDNININLNPYQTYLIETINPNNKEARINREQISFDANSLTVNPVLGSDESGKKSDQILFQDEIEYEISMQKLNDSNNPLIQITNKSDRDLNIYGYIIFYEDTEKTQIDGVVEMKINGVPANGIYKDYLSLRASSEMLESLNYDVYINICE